MILRGFGHAGVCLFACAGLFFAACTKSPSSNDLPAPTIPKLPEWMLQRGLEGKASWDSISGTVRITKDVVFGGDNDLETFYWQIPKLVKTLVIAANTTVTGGFRADHQMTIKGESRNTSVIFGTNTVDWSRGPNGQDDSPDCNTAGGDDRVPDCRKWQYSAISAINLPPGDTLYVNTLTIKNARAYNITSITHPIKVDNVYMLEQRAIAGASNCDGFGGGAGSAITNSTIEVTDDAVKLYRGMTVKNVTIILRRNGAPFQLGWGSEPTSAHTIENVIVRGTDPQARYNCGLFSWKSTTANTTRTITINGLKTENLENSFIWGGSALGWQPAPLFEIRSAQSKLILNGNQLSIAYPAISFPQTNSTVQIGLCGTTVLKAQYQCGNLSGITGNN